MTWQSILKYGRSESGKFQENKVEELAELIAEFLDKNIEVIPYGGVNYNLNNASDIIEMAKIGLTKSWYAKNRKFDLERGEFMSDGRYNYFQTSVWRKFDLTAPNNLKLFMATMKQRGYDMDMFDVKGLLTQGSSKDSQQTDYTSQIKQTIQMLTRMNKPITKESIMYEIDMEESEWNDKYNKLLQERLQ